MWVVIQIKCFQKYKEQQSKLYNADMRVLGHPNLKQNIKKVT